jgi:replicative DNA helicase
MVINQLEALVRSDVMDRELAVQSYKKEIFNSIRGLYARNSQQKAESAKLKKTLKDFFNIDLVADTKIVLFESDCEDVIQSLISCEKEFLNSELMELRKMTEKSMTSLEFKFNESEREFLSIKDAINSAIFNEMEKRAHA